MEVRYRTDTYVVEWLCEECHEASMKPTGQMNLGKVNNFPHVCSNDECKHEQTFLVKYPYTEYVKVIEGRS